MPKASALPERPSQRLKQTRRFRETAQGLGLRIRQLRETQSLTLEQASARMDVDLKHLQKVEAGQLNVTLVTLLRIADGFEVPLAELFSLLSYKKRKNS